LPGKSENPQSWHARAAGFWFIFYIAALIIGNMLAASAGGSPLVNRGGLLITTVAGLSAIPLGFSLYVLLRRVNAEWALVAFAWRVGEGVLNGAASAARFALAGLGEATSPAVVAASDSGQALRAFASASLPVSILFFAIGSWIFFILIQRSRLLPGWLCWSGVVGSACALALGLLSLLLPDRPTWLLALWLPLAVAEIVGGIILLAGRGNLGALAEPKGGGA
jgi:uncharacterized protein DUF4386